MAASAETIFEPLPIRRRTLLPVDPNQYNITTAPGETKQIKANTAYEAFRLSGFKHAIKIERLSNIERPLLGKELFKEDVASKLAGALIGADPADRDAFNANHRKKLIVSADELDALMHTLQEIAEHAPMVERAQSAPVTLSPVAPVPTAAAPTTPVPGPSGLDVKGEGFDEIIPAAPAAKPTVAAKPAESKLTEATPATDAPAAAPLPERELSHEEIEKLLGGK